jgi:ABC-2 type transport system ATP-binding protein
MIQTDGLSKNYGRNDEIHALENMSITVCEGETFGLLGPNGAGKTTTVRILTGIIKPASGSAIVNGYDLIREKEEVKRSTGLLAESPGIYDKLSAREFLEFMGALYDVPQDILMNRIQELLRLFGLHDRGDHLVEGFSTGMRQKLLLAAALIHDPPILFLDEPTSSLDPAAAHMVKDLIKQLAKTAGKTIFLCSHQLPIVEELCDRIGIISEGKLIAIGSVVEMKARAGVSTLEETFIKLTGVEVAGELLGWRGEKVNHL